MNFWTLAKLAESIATSEAVDAQHQIVAFAVKGGAPIAYGVNKLRYRSEGSVFRCSIHAEMDLLNKLKERAAGCKIFVYRFNNTSNPTAREVHNAKPCLFCQHLLRKANVAKVQYLSDEGVVETMKKSDMAELIADPIDLTEHFVRKIAPHNSENFKPKMYLVANG